MYNENENINITGDTRNGGMPRISAALQQHAYKSLI
jgi:hypothetical protein